MVLVVRVANEEARFWVTRSVWLALHEVLNGVISEDPGGRSQLSKPLARTPNDGIGEEATLLHGVAWKRHAGGITLTFRSAGPRVSFALPDAGVRRVCTMLESLAERAGWDTAAGLERIRAGRLATTVVRRARA